MTTSCPRLIGNYWLEECLGSGYSGSIFRAHHVHTGQLAAIKLQDIAHECPTNRYERCFYPLLQGGEGMPRLLAAGVEGKWDYLVIDLLGPSLDSLYRKANKPTMDLRSVCSIAIQIISRLKVMHMRGILHRDIQLGNCAIGLPPNDRMIYMIDFGFSKQYIDPVTRRHIPESKAKRSFVGNYWFSSVNVHCRGKVPSRRDDLEAAALMFIHLLTPGGLEWTRKGVPKSDSQHRAIKKAKQRAQPEDLCRGLPAEFEEFLRYCRRLSFTETLDYDRWVDRFKDLALERGFVDIEQFAWPPPEPRVEPRSIPNALKQPAADPREMEEMIHNLANLQLNKRPALGDHTNIQAPAQREQVKNGAVKDVIAICSDSDSSRRSRQSKPSPPARLNKALQLHQLALSVADATDNKTLSAIVARFVALLQSNRSRTLTKEGFAVLDALYKQLADPSVFAVRLRTARTRSADQNENGDVEPRYVKLGALAGLRRDVAIATNNKALAKLVATFGSITDKSTGRTITKDGFAFLEGLAARLQALS